MIVLFLMLSVAWFSCHKLCLLEHYNLGSEWLVMLKVRRTLRNLNQNFSSEYHKWFQIVVFTCFTQIFSLLRLPSIIMISRFNYIVAVHVTLFNNVMFLSSNAEHIALFSIRNIMKLLDVVTDRFIHFLGLCRWLLIVVQIDCL